jgi:membrane-bound lytic murein transglycosylase B
MLVASALLFACFSAPAVMGQTTLEQVSTERSELQKQLAELEKEIAGYQSQLKTIKGQKNTLVNRISELKKQQELIAAQMKMISLQVSDLETQEMDIQKTADAALARGKSIQESMKTVISAIAREDDRPFLYSLVMSDSLSEAFADRNAYVRLAGELGGLLRGRQAALDEANASLRTIAAKREQKNELLRMQGLQQKQLIGSVSSQNALLSQTKGKESAYQAQLSDTQKEVAAIRNRLYRLLEVSKQITFGQAVAIAQWAEGQTGVRAAFLLAVLTQESNLGQNVGTCNRAGDPPSKSWRVVMKPGRDQEPFKTITSELGLNINTTPVSCPMRDKSGNQIGWGGAMGPAQFIPSTWMGYRSKVTAITGKAANPWDIRDAFLAAAIKLKADGGGTKSGEWAAAMRYFSGGTNTAYRFYGDSVVKMAEEYADDIAKLNP